MDAVSIDDFAADEGNNLYKLWNRMSSGSYSRGRCEPLRYRRIMGPGSGFSVLANVADRVAEAAAAMLGEEKA